MKSYNVQNIEYIARIFGDLYKGNQITTLINKALRIQGGDNSEGQTKWKRINYYLEQIQDDDTIHKLIEVFIDPSAFLTRPNEHNEVLKDLNRILIYYGYFIGENGKVIKKEKRANTISEANERFKELYDALNDNSFHPALLNFCKEEYLQDSYFACVFEACKGIYSIIQQKTGLKENSEYNLIEKALNYNSKDKNSYPYLIINYNIVNDKNIETEQRGLKNLILGVHQSLRCPMAHTPHADYKINIGKEEALEILNILSYIYKKLDNLLVIPHL